MSQEKLFRFAQANAAALQLERFEDATGRAQDP
jgi:hypothetical protein